MTTSPQAQGSRPTLSAWRRRIETTLAAALAATLLLEGGAFGYSQVWGEGAVRGVWCQPASGPLQHARGDGGFWSACRAQLGATGRRSSEPVTAYRAGFGKVVVTTRDRAPADADFLPDPPVRKDPRFIMLRSAVSDELAGFHGAGGCLTATTAPGAVRNILAGLDIRGWQVRRSASLLLPGRDEACVTGEVDARRRTVVLRRKEQVGDSLNDLAERDRRVRDQVSERTSRPACISRQAAISAIEETLGSNDLQTTFGTTHGNQKHPSSTIAGYGPLPTAVGYADIQVRPVPSKTCAVVHLQRRDRWAFIVYG